MNEIINNVNAFCFVLGLLFGMFCLGMFFLYLIMNKTESPQEETLA